jgi:hypothetical protein
MESVKKSSEQQNKQTTTKPSVSGRIEHNLQQEKLRKITFAS